MSVETFIKEIICEESIRQTDTYTKEEPERLYHVKGLRDSRQVLDTMGQNKYENSRIW